MKKPITERQQAFLDAYRVTGMVKPAAAQAGCSRELHYGAMRTSETYRQEFSLVQQRLADELEEEMWQRAVYGVKIPKFYRGKVIGYDIRYSDTLLMCLLEANDPEKFGWVRKELQEQGRDAGFCVRWDRDEVGRPTLPRMTGPQPPAPPRPPRPPVPSISELGIPVTYAEWAAARGITGTAPCGPVDEEKIQSWAAGGECSPIDWVPDETATDLVSDGADLCQAAAGIDDPESDDSDVDFCVRWDAAEPEGQNDRLAPEEMGDARAPGRGNDSRQTESTATVGRFPVRKRLRRGRAPAPRQVSGRPSSQTPRLGVAASFAQPIVPRRPGPAGRWDPADSKPGAMAPDGRFRTTIPAGAPPLYSNLPQSEHWRRSPLCATHRSTPPRSSGTPVGPSRRVVFAPERQGYSCWGNQVASTPISLSPVFERARQRAQPLPGTGFPRDRAEGENPTVASFLGAARLGLSPPVSTKKPRESGSWLTRLLDLLEHRPSRHDVLFPTRRSNG